MLSGALAVLCLVLIVRGFAQAFEEIPWRHSERTFRRRLQDTSRSILRGLWELIRYAVPRAILLLGAVILVAWLVTALLDR